MPIKAILIGNHSYGSILIDEDGNYHYGNEVITLANSSDLFSIRRDVSNYTRDYITFKKAGYYAYTAWGTTGQPRWYNVGDQIAPVISGGDVQYTVVYFGTSDPAN